MSLSGKIFRILALVFIFVGFWAFFTYNNLLRFKEDAALEACWGVDLFDNSSGEKVVGVEDIDFHPETGTLFLSAYDRRAVAREREAGRVSTQGGIYTLNIADIHKTGSLGVRDITKEFKDAGNEFRPHGIFVDASGLGLLAINRRAAGPGSDRDFDPVLVNFIHDGENWSYYESFRPEGLCDPYDVVFLGAGYVFSFIYTDVAGACREEGSGTRGGVQIFSKKGLNPVLKDLDFPNGLALTRNFLAVAETRNDSIHFVGLENQARARILEIPLAPDNLSVDEENNLYAAGFTNLLDYYFFMRGWFGVSKSPSAVIRIEPDQDFKQTLMFKDNGAMISGATVAQRAGDFLVMGAAWDDNIAICEGMDGLDG